MRQSNTALAHTRANYHDISVGSSLSEILVADKLHLEVKHLQVAATKRLNPLSASSLSLSCFINDQQFHLFNLSKMPFFEQRRSKKS
jgi:hypothetical protein